MRVLKKNFDEQQPFRLKKMLRTTITLCLAVSVETGSIGALYI